MRKIFTRLMINNAFGHQNEIVGTISTPKNRNKPERDAMKDIGSIIKNYRKHYTDLTQAQLGAKVFGLAEEIAQTKMSKIEAF